MVTKDNEQDFVDSIKSELDESVQNINVGDLSTINQIRHQALAGKQEEKSSWVLIPVGAMATICLAVVVYNFIQVAPVTSSGQENTELVSVLEDFEIYDDPALYYDLEFYEWLDAYQTSS